MGKDLGMISTKFLIGVLVTASVSGCNSKNLKTTGNQPVNASKNSQFYPPPSANAADVQIDDVAIGSSEAATKDFSKKRVSGDQDFLGNSNSDDQNDSTAPRDSIRNYNKTNPSGASEYSPLQSDSSDEENISNSPFKTENIAMPSSEEQREFTKRDRISGTKSTNYSYSSSPSEENIGPVLNLGAKIKTASTTPKEIEDKTKSSQNSDLKTNKEKANKLKHINSFNLENSEDQSAEASQSKTMELIERKGLGNETRAGYEPPTSSPPEKRDDDIIVRQLQEAASSEQNPMLREKLWKEYERYKGGL